MNPEVITTRIMWDLWSEHDEIITADVIERGVKAPVHDLTLQQAMAKLLNANNNEPINVRITIEVIA
jgi:hypothetical protein